MLNWYVTIVAVGTLGLGVVWKTSDLANAFIKLLMLSMAVWSVFVFLQANHFIIRVH